MLGEYPEIFCFSYFLLFPLGHLALAAGWCCVPGHFLLLRSLWGWIWGLRHSRHHLCSRCLLALWPSRAVRRDIAHTGFVHTGLRGVGDAGPAFPQVSCQFAVGVWTGLGLIRQVKNPGRKLLLTYRMLWELALCVCTQRTSQEIPFVDLCPWALPAIQMAMPGWSPQLSTGALLGVRLLHTDSSCMAVFRLLHGFVQGLLSFTAAHAGEGSHFHPNTQEWAINCLEHYLRIGRGWRCSSCVIPPAQEWSIEIQIYTHTNFLSAALSISLLSSCLKCPVPWLHNPAFAQITDSSSSIFLLEPIFWVIDHFHCSLVNQNSCFPSNMGLQYHSHCGGWGVLRGGSCCQTPHGHFFHPSVILGLLSSLWENPCFPGLFLWTLVLLLSIP